jgi:hypothetical protein
MAHVVGKILYGGLGLFVLLGYNGRMEEQMA